LEGALRGWRLEAGPSADGGLRRGKIEDERLRRSRRRTMEDGRLKKEEWILILKIYNRQD
jgi:hypothetical protein